MQLPRSRFLQVPDQRAALYRLAKLAQDDIRKPIIFKTARYVIGGTNSRDEAAELDAIYKAVHDGTPFVPELARGLGVDPRTLQFGFGYVLDPKAFDAFVAPARLLEMSGELAARGGQLKGDCDEHAALNACLAAALGFAAGLRAWGEEGEDYVHVFAVAGLPKIHPTQIIALDTCVDKYAGWQPDHGHVLTAWIAGSTDEIRGLRG